MKQIVLPVALALALALSAQAEETSTDKGFDLMEKGARLLFEGLMQEMQPALPKMEDLSENFEPAIRGFAQNIGPKIGAFL